MGWNDKVGENSVYRSPNTGSLVAAVYKEDGKWKIIYAPGGEHKKGVPLVNGVELAVETLEEAKAVTIALMRMS